MFQCNKKSLYSSTKPRRLKVPSQHWWSTQCFNTAHIADSNPALKRQLSILSSYTALMRAISSFSLRLTLVTNASRVTEASSSTASFPEALILEPYNHKKTSPLPSIALILVYSNNSRWQRAFKLASYSDRKWTVQYCTDQWSNQTSSVIGWKPDDIIDSYSVTI